MAATTEQSDERTQAKGRGLNAELKRRLVDHLDMLKRPNDIVRVTQVTNHHFRVNTLSPSSSPDRVMETYRITKSQFLRAEDRAGELVISDQTLRN